MRSVPEETITEIHPAILDVIYRVMLKRIAGGFTQEELSFLLGHNPDFVRKIEFPLAGAEYRITDLFRLTLIFQCREIDFLPGYTGPEKSVKVAGRVWRDSRKIYREIRKVSDGSREILFKLEEDDPEFRNDREVDRDMLLKSERVIASLAEAGFFSGSRSPLELFYCCRSQAGSRVMPKHVMNALNGYVKSARPKLRRYRQKFQGYVYSQ